jgi:hypothetical protein
VRPTSRVLAVTIAALVEVASSYAGNISPNLLANPNFQNGSAAPQSVSGTNAVNTSAGLSWYIFSLSGMTTTELCTDTCPSGTLLLPPPMPGSGLLHVTTENTDSGVFQFTGYTNSGPAVAMEGVWIYVLSGGAEIGMGNEGAPVGDGRYGPVMNASTTLLNQWVYLTSTTPNLPPPNQSPVNEMFIYSSGGPSEFFAAAASLTDPPPAAAIAPEPSTLFTTSILLAMAGSYTVFSAATRFRKPAWIYASSGSARSTGPR